MERGGISTNNFSRDGKVGISPQDIWMGFVDGNRAAWLRQLVVVASGSLYMDIRERIN